MLIPYLRPISTVDYWTMRAERLDKQLAAFVLVAGCSLCIDRLAALPERRFRPCSGCRARCRQFRRWTGRALLPAWLLNHHPRATDGPAESGARNA